MSLGKEQELFMRDFAKLLNFLHESGYEVRGGELERTQTMQEIYVKQGKSKTMRSNHLRRLAVDLHIFKDGRWLQEKSELSNIGEYWESLNEANRWGGNFKSFYDAPHFERNAQI